MDVSAFLSEASFWIPERSDQPSVESGFYPVAYWLVDAARPLSIAGIGPGEAGIFLALREAVKRLGLATARAAVEPLDGSELGRKAASTASPGAWEGRAQDVEITPRRTRGTIKEIIASFSDGSIDLIHPFGPSSLNRFGRDLAAWRPKLSERAILLAPRAGVREERGGTLGVFQELARRHPSFLFNHGDGLGLVALGEAPPDRLRALFDADENPELRDAIRRAYSRLGRGLVEGPAAAEPDFEDSVRGPMILGLGHSNRGRSGGDSHCEFGDAADGLAEIVLREENELLREETEQLRETTERLRDATERLSAESGALDEKSRSLTRESAALRQEILELRQHAAHFRQLHANANEQLDDLRRSTTLVLVEKGRRFRGRYFPQTRLHGRCLELMARFARVSIQTGPRLAVEKAAKRVLRKVGLAKRPLAPTSHSDAQPVAVSGPTASSSGKSRFEELPWSYSGSRSHDESNASPTLKVLLVGHSACRTGAPLCLLRLSEELAKLPEVECWTVLKNGGELSPQFARHAPTLDLAALEARGVPRRQGPAEIAARFREFSKNAVAICNTMAVSEFHEALGAANVPVLSWVHELPTFIDILGGRQAIERIKKASRRTIVPADVVREALIKRFEFDPSRIQTMYYGLDAKTRGQSRDAMRARVRDELGLPDDARIVLGCGTIDLRKGADLFAQMGTRFLRDVAPADLASRTYFFWIGHPSDQDLRKWLLHDIENAGLSDRVRFLGTREDMSPYFLAADLFALTSREDPCPFANLEAMESSLAVVAFQGSGGAPEVLGAGGVAVPYLDVAAMAEAARDLLADDAKRSTMGESGRSTIRGRFTWPRFMNEFREILEAEYGLGPSSRPSVSVIVPNYRHAQYLEDRLRSIFEQTVLPREIIFLDDASPDDSVEIARRLALESPVPMRVIVNESNSGSTFRQWLKGIGLAEGELIWIAESDDSAHPEFLERMLPEFRDQEVVLAYCQSALIDSEGRLLLRNFLRHTDDISHSRWRSRYAATSGEEAEIALSQKNTIPNASAVVFRRCDQMDYAEELAGLRFAGDWLFYAMRIRGGKIAFSPDVLNRYRRHEKSVSFQSCKADTHAEETLHVKIRLFETFSVSVNAMNRGLGQTFLEYSMLTERFGLKRPPLTLDGRAPIARLLDRARNALNRRIDGRGELKILFILDSARGGADGLASLHLINALARDHQVFLCLATPLVEGEALAGELDDRVVPIEGTLEDTPWSSTGCLSHHRVDVLKEMTRIHAIDVIHSQFGRGDRLAARINVDLKLPWFVHMDDGNGCWLDNADDPASGQALATVTGVFHEGTNAARLIERRPELAGKRWIRALDGLDPDALPRPTEPIRKREGEFLVFLLTDDARWPSDSANAMSAVRLVNRLSHAERGGRRVRLVMPGETSASSSDAADSASSSRGGAEELALMAQCDLAIAPNAGEASRVSSRVAALLAHHVPIIAPDKGAIHDMLSSAGARADLEIESDGRPTLSANRLATGILRYLKRPDLHPVHRERAGRLFGERFHVDQNLAVREEAYLHARDFLVFTRAVRSEPPKEDRAARESA